MLLFQDKVQKFHIPKLAKNLHLNDEPINIISDTCSTVNKEMASAFIKNEDIIIKKSTKLFL